MSNALNSNLNVAYYTMADLYGELDPFDFFTDWEMPSLADESEVLALMDAGKENVLEYMAARREELSETLFEAMFPEPAEYMVTDQPVKDRMRKPRRSDGRGHSCSRYRCEYAKCELENLRRRVKERALKEAQLEAAEYYDQVDSGDDGDMSLFPTPETCVMFTPLGAAVYVGC